uniref:Phosphatidylinositol-specific phospholipase C, X domain containing 3 n=1 Tax=Callorhinchus milii TaxID=7868 RepID=A0A4W3GJZ2_CALMI
LAPWLFAGTLLCTNWLLCFSRCPAPLCVTGSHDSFSCHKDEASLVGPEQPDSVQNLVLVLGSVGRRLARRWLATQSLDVSRQLAAGVRYLDLRVSTKARDPDNQLYFAQGLPSGAVSAGLADISRFLAAQPREVVLLDFNHFYGLQKCHHEALVRALREAFGEKLCPVTFTEEVSLRYLWDWGYQVLVFYHHPVALDVPFLWPGQMMPSSCANTTDPDKLSVSLGTALAQRHRRPGTFFVSPLVLTPKPSTMMRAVAGETGTGHLPSHTPSRSPSHTPS